MSELRAGHCARMLLLALLLPLLGSCVKNEFHVEVELAEDSDSHFTFLYYASDPEKGWLVEEVVLADQGKLGFVGKTRNPTLVYVFAHGREPRGIFYAERGNHLSVKNAGQDPDEWKIEGNEISEGLSDWRISNKDALRAGGETVNSAVEEYVSKNRSNPVSALLLLLYYDRGFDEAGFRKLWGTLEGDAADGEWPQLAGQLDVESAATGFPKMPTRILLNSMEHGVDTIMPGSKPILLYFGRNGIDGRESDIRKLRELTREWKDSSTRVIAEIGLDADSGSRIWPVRRDSLRTVIHAWMPLGLSDSLAAALGVGGLPRFVVIDRKGKRAYNGTDREEAARIFLKQRGGETGREE